ncbi:uncharacterized protein LOC128893070 [Hylaeus anthracinus]|uniref:uncharacterized protein LOC128893070 n=1 Tax=Hylaeus anthracinus TaxID=313031 RepID=UPI0023B96141|nr:uncharacterized protein LOC128893070 [Hylaeus anthracinus]
MGEDNQSKPERTLRPIMFVSWLLGVGVARPKKCPKAFTMILHALHFGVCTVSVAFAAIDFADFHEVFSSDLFEIMYCVNEVIRHVSAYYYVCHVIQHYDKWPALMKMMESLDQHIGTEVPVNEKAVKIKQILAVLTVCLLGPVSLTAHVVYYYFTAPDQIYASDLLLYYTIAQTLANSFVFDIIVYMICQRFRSINATIERMDEKLGAPWTASKIRRIRKLHSEACSVVATVNEIYGIDLLLCSTNAFVTVVAKLFRIYMSAKEQQSGFIFLNNVIWLIYGLQFVVMCWVCTLTHREINKIGLCIEEFALNTQHSSKFNRLAPFRSFRQKEPTWLQVYDDRSDLYRYAVNLNGFGMESLPRTDFDRDCVRSETNDFILQLQVCRVKFTACDFFEMDNSLLTRFISVITTYLIILVQFYETKEHKNR